MTEPRTVVMVHPDDVNLADAKAAAARYDATVIGNRFCPRGTMFLVDGAALALWDLPESPGDES